MLKVTPILLDLSHPKSGNKSASGLNSDTLDSNHLANRRDLPLVSCPSHSEETGKDISETLGT